MPSITTLVLPVAGLGTRLRPLTDFTPKALVCLHHKPLLEYILEETIGTDIKKVVLIVSPEHFDQFQNYIAQSAVKFPHLHFETRVQEKPLGNGHALLQVQNSVVDQPFIVRYTDDPIIVTPSPIVSLIDIFERLQAPVLLVKRVPKEMMSRFGMIQGGRIEPRIHRISHIVEKPKQEEINSDLGIIGGYIVTPFLMNTLEKMSRAMETKNDALPLTNAFIAECAKKNPVYGFEFDGAHLDCGTLESFYDAEKIVNSL
ncbi:MAG: 2-C-methyl-D-erythritol 4-phosphate cytidylyltransferase [Parcubacteria group bacterium]|nr:2-C-methyl-D-erythritol 4-phosphate cytidylyltransferase [Parcubacteria group bacterium]